MDLLLILLVLVIAGGCALVIGDNNAVNQKAKTEVEAKREEAAKEYKAGGTLPEKVEKAEKQQEK